MASRNLVLWKKEKNLSTLYRFLHQNSIFSLIIYTDIIRFIRVVFAN